MQSGLFFIWTLFVGFSLLAWLYLKVFFEKEKGHLSRRRITGCELARQVLDRNHQHQTSVRPIFSARNAHFGLDFNQLLLSEKAYYGTGLKDLAITLHETAHLLVESKPSLLVEFWAKIVRFLQMTLLLSWLLVIGGIFLPPFRWMVSLGQVLFVVLFFRALASLAKEWEVTELALTQLASLDGFGTDERVKMKKLLQAIRWVRLAELFGEPLALFRKRGKNSSHVS